MGDNQKMMMRLCLSLFVFFLLSACSPEKQSIAVKSDFDVFCEQFTLLTESADFSSLTGEDRAIKLDSMLSGKLEPSTNAYIAWTAIRNSPPSERYFLYKDAAASIGAGNWKCPAVEQYGHEVGSPHD